jgi:hypothetical protein
MYTLGVRVLVRRLPDDEAKKSANFEKLLEAVVYKVKRLMVISKDIRDRQWSHAK